MSKSESRRALVLASSAGIGYACATALASEGLSVCLNGRDADRLEDAERKLLGRHPHAQLSSCVADLNLDADRQHLLSQAGDIDVLVLNMGGPAATTEALSLDDWQSAFETVFLPMADILDQVLPGMMRRGWGRVVMISSVAVKQPIPNLLVSGVFRTGLANLVSARAAQAAPSGVTINSILPGRILTARQSNALERDARRAGVSREAYERTVSAAIPMGRLGLPEEIAHVCAFLCSEGASYLTGQHLLVDGGAYKGMF
ncbi:SDR family oxidoreductase [Allopusillimonas ginsengisoli]|uniref:SDR family oxidoreductase n=1 Tax=Allopusillimonas ginsengisoli TaxID=453575 RepID=UPI0010223D18|nr:SDR family oxidoreductase [Allopusillimonas ginsengisoli]TEA79982.1 SDR family oxidoreductase [Allopusillimonas ginsengisoli]